MVNGLSPDIFWTLTPWQFYVFIEAAVRRKEIEHDHAAWFMWQGARLPLLKKFPDLKAFLINNKKPVKGIDENAIMTRLKAYQERFQNGADG